jgi:hypothetical protein
MSRAAAMTTILSLALLLFGVSRAQADVTAERSPNGVVVKIDGQFFTEYLVFSGAKPILWPVLGPTGKPMTRAYPLGETPDERKDHIHQRSVWFTHGDVNGVSFWDEMKSHGDIKHREFVKIESGATAQIVTRNDWVSQEGKRVCEDQRCLTFGRDGENRWIDFDITLKATDGPVKFGDTKEGAMGVRVAETIKVDAKQGGKIVNSDGLADQAAWGKRASWVDYYGPVEGQTVGIAMLNHPSSFRYPTYWHVRTYGLFAANPFGLHDFLGKNAKDADGSYTLKAGESLSLRYRLVFHKGSEKEGRIAETWEKYSKDSKQ